MSDPLKLYLKDIKDIPLLTAQQEIQLARKIRRGDKQARAVMIRSNLRLVINIAKRYGHLGVPLSDLIEEGNLGLMKAVTKYNPRRGFRFSTYGAWWIRQYITRAIANQGKTVRIPVYMTELMAQWKRVNEQLTQRLGRKPTSKEVAKRMRLSEKKAKFLSEIPTTTTSLDAPVGEEDNATVLDLIQDMHAASPSDEMQNLLRQEHIARLLAKMSEREREILHLRYGLKDGISRTLGETAKHFGITRERVRQIEGVAIKKLRALLAQEGGEPFQPLPKKATR